MRLRQKRLSESDPFVLNIEGRKGKKKSKGGRKMLPHWGQRKVEKTGHWGKRVGGKG